MSIQPNNAGIDFQNRVAAWIIYKMLMDIELSITFDLNSEYLIEKIAFETNDEIDDLVITTNCNKKLFLQIKRTLNLTVGEKSDFHKAIYQFVNRYIKDSKSDDLYVLVTTTNSSKAIRNELKNLFDSIRLNKFAIEENPLNNKEKEAFRKFKNIVYNIYRNIKNEKMADSQFNNFMEKVLIVILDIEKNQIFEKNVFVAIQSQISNTPPKLLWSLLIKEAAAFSSKRLSVTSLAMKEKWENYLTYESERVDKKDEYTSFLQPKVEIDSIELGRDVILVEQMSQHGDKAIKNLVLAELFRFNDDGTKRQWYEASEYVILADGKLKFKILHRTATTTGMVRYLNDDSNADFLEKYNEIKVVPAIGIEDVENTTIVEIHREHLRRFIDSNVSESLNCVHCGKGISEKCYLVEIDDLYEKSIIGLAHIDCLRAIDRVLGMPDGFVFGGNEYIKKFDFYLWIKSLHKSQGLFGELKSRRNVPPIIPMLWNPQIGKRTNLDYCVKMNLVNEDFNYVYRRGKIERLTKKTAEEYLQTFVDSIAIGKKDNDPLSIDMETRSFGRNSDLLKFNSNMEEIIEIESIEIVKYVEHLGQRYNTINNYYAPLIIIILKKTEEPLIIGDHVVFLSEVLSIKSYIKNWEDAGLCIGEYELDIIATDEKFDNFMWAYNQKNIEGVVDPIFSRQKELVRGMLIEDINKAKEKF